MHSLRNHELDDHSMPPAVLDLRKQLQPQGVLSLPLYKVRLKVAGQSITG